MRSTRDTPPHRFREARNDLVAFNNAYLEYLGCRFPADSRHVSTQEVYRARQAAQDLIPRATLALQLASIDLAIYPPRAFGGVVLNGLPNAAFAHESNAGYIGSGTMTYQHVLDAVRTAIGYLEVNEAEVIRHRRNPLYWGDRLLRTFLGIPAYLVSLVVGVPLERLQRPPWGLAFGVIGLAANAATIYGVGLAATWW